MLSHFITFHKA